MLDNFVRGRRENLRLRLQTGNVRLVEGDIRDRPLVRSLMAGIDLVFHQAAIRITQCADGAAARPRGPRRRHLRGHRGRGRRRGPQGRRSLVSLRLRPGGGLPDPGTPAPLRQRHPLRRGEDLQRRPAPQLSCDARAGLRHAALLQRVRAADGYPRPLHRGPDPLDGTDRSRTAAADPRRRQADDGLRVHRGHRPREPAGRHQRRHRRGLQHRQRRGDKSDRAG